MARPVTENRLPNYYNVESGRPNYNYIITWSARRKTKKNEEKCPP